MLYQNNHYPFITIWNFIILPYRILQCSYLIDYLSCGKASYYITVFCYIYIIVVYGK